ncbi:MAG: hypothetical protein MJ193_00595 [Clostridia bacterium]|nr:hypothetical protein [Clostridia bacterium]
MISIPKQANAKGLTDMVDDKIVSFYEEEIAGENVVTRIDFQAREKMKKSLKIDDGKLNSVIILKDLGERTNNPQTLQNLSKQSDKQLFLTAKTLISKYCETLSPEEKARLKQEFLEILREK